MIIVTGLSVTLLILSSNGWPQPGFFVSTTTTPVVVTKTALLPPPPVIMNRLSFSSVTSTTRGAGCVGAPPRRGACCSAATVMDNRPVAISVPNTTCLFMHPPAFAKHGENGVQYTEATELTE